MALACCTMRRARLRRIV
jgi:hypothetical protein